MAAYSQFGYGGYPSASQLISSKAAQSPQTGDTPAAHSTISSANTPALSPPEDCRANTASGDVSSSALSPAALSQSSKNAGAGTSALNSTADPSAMGHVSASGSSCCENGRPIMTDPVSGQTVCSCQYDSARIALSSYSRLPTGSVGVYGTTYPSTDQNPYQSIGVDNSAFYSPLSNPYALKDTATGTEMTAWTSAGLQPTTGYYSYDPMSAYGYGASYDLAARRKNATRESTATLKAWLNEHKKNPYPTKGEKIMLAIITKMTLTQVSTWFANARRRLKKENKMTWEPKNRTDDDDDAMVSDDEKDKDDLDATNKSALAVKMSSSNAAGVIGDHEKDEDDFTDEDHKPANHPTDSRSGLNFPGGSYYSSIAAHPQGYHSYHHQHSAYYQHQQAMLAVSYHSSGNNNISNKIEFSDPKNQLARDCGVPIPATKPKIWSLADTVACKTPPPASYMEQQQQHLSIQQQQRPNHHMGMQQHQQHMPQMLQQTPNLMNDFGVTPYSRTPTTAYGGFLGTTVQQQQQLHSTDNTQFNNNNINCSNNINISININNSSHNSSSSNCSSDSHTLTTPITTATTTTTAAEINPLAQQQLQVPLLRQSSHHHPSASNQRVGMGFLEAQPDTPPQTPPNMKLSSVASAANLLLTGSQVPTTTICRNINAVGYGGGGGGSVPQYGMNYSTRFGEYSPRDDSSNSSSSYGSASTQLEQSELLFKPLFKSQKMSLAEFVSPVQ